MKKSQNTNRVMIGLQILILIAVIITAFTILRKLPLQQTAYTDVVETIVAKNNPIVNANYNLFLYVVGGLLLVGFILTIYRLKS